MNDTRHNVLSSLVGNSPQMLQVKEQIAQFAPLPYPVLLTGETGTGKEVVARLLHLMSGRVGQFVAINCGAVSDSVLESELFGHEKGAYTGADESRAGLIQSADGGSLFLDEIESMSGRMQAALLRFIETGDFNRVGSSQTERSVVRIVSATNKPLSECGGFRQDLSYRLTVLQIDLPPLRNRRSDIPILFGHLITRARQELNSYARVLSVCAEPEPSYQSGTAWCSDEIRNSLLGFLNSYDWPGNVRELQTFARLCVALGADNALKCFVGRAASGKKVLSRQEFIRDFSAVSDLGASEAAKKLGVSRVTVWRHRKKITASSGA